jgi:hypothetical protein
MDQPRPLDLVLFNTSTNPYSAHLGVWMAQNEILHLNKEIGFPAVWSDADFARLPNYETIVGFKRIAAVS